MNERKALGRGLGALIPGAPQKEGGEKRGLAEIPVGEILANKYQPRKDFDEAGLAELAASVKEKGILQPVVVRRAGEGKYELIAGERRLRAAKRAGLASVPAVIKDVSDLESLELALIENIQRRDLNPIEEAHSYASLVGEFGLTQEDLARRVGRERSTVANMLRLLKLPTEIQRDLAEARLAMGHARALLALPDQASQMQVRAEVIAKALSVRATEALVAGWKPTTPKRKAVAEPPKQDIEMKRAAEDLKRRIGASVAFRGSAKRGRIEIAYGSLQELNRILAVLLDR